jgi:hypothetical protein
MKFELPDLTPWHHPQDVPQDVVNAIMSYQPCFLGRAIHTYNDKIELDTVVLRWFCRTCQRVETKPFRTVCTIRLAIAKTKEEFYHWLDPSAYVSHLCRCNLCSNPAHVRIEPLVFNHLRNRCPRQVFRPRIVGNRADTELRMRQVNSLCRHGDDTSRCFPMGSSHRSVPRASSAA